MPKFNEADLFLMKKWADVVVLTEGIAHVRERYDEVLDAANDEVMRRHPQLNVTRKWPKRSSYSAIGIGKTIWPEASYGAPSGFYVEDISLENLTSAEAASPFKDVWIYTSSPEKHLERMRTVAEKTISKEEFRKWTFDSDNSGIGCWRELEPRDDLFKLLTDDANEFVDRLVGHFESMVPFIPVIEQVVRLIKGR